MGEEDMRARQNSIDAHILAIEQKLDSLRLEIEESIRDDRHNTHETHAKLYQRIHELERDMHELKGQVEGMLPTLEAARRHIETDVPVDVARDQTISRAVVYIIGLCCSGFIGWLFSRFGGNAQ